jgi:HTH-type transcriptional regulator / antitoxin HigA
LADKSAKCFNPVVAVSPRETIREDMVYLGLNQEELTARLGMSAKHLSKF